MSGCAAVAHLTQAELFELFELFLYPTIIGFGDAAINPLIIAIKIACAAAPAAIDGIPAEIVDFPAISITRNTAHDLL